MPKPEIARRCPSCGVSIRVQASFCPECGKPLKMKPDAVTEADNAEALSPNLVTPELSGDMSEFAATTPLVSPVAIPLDSKNTVGPRIDRDSQPDPDADDAEALAPVPLTPEVGADTSEFPATMPLVSKETVGRPAAHSAQPSATYATPRQATVGVVPRRGSPPREVVGEYGHKRVEKFRQMSTAVIDEASYDPSLRFVLVAAVLFVLFLLLLILSELIT